MYQSLLIPAKCSVFSKRSQSPLHLKFILLSNLLEFPIIFIPFYYLISIISLIYILIFFLLNCTSKVLGGKKDFRSEFSIINPVCVNHKYLIS